MVERATTLEREWMGRVARLGCVLCVFLGMPQTTPTTVHHMKEGTGLGQRSPHFLSIALCREHHQGKTGLHGLGTKAFAALYDVEEADLLNLTIEGVYRGATGRRPAVHGLAYGWKLPGRVEDLIGLLNTYGGQVYKEHADLIRAFFASDHLPEGSD